MMNAYQDSQAANRSRASRLRGFSLVELMITIVIFAILLGLAMPSFSDSTLNNKLGTYSNDMVASTLLARNEALKRNAVVTMCVSTDGATCTAGGWEQGWIILAGATLVQFHPPMSSGWKMTESSAASSLTFQPTGVGATTATLTICRANPLGHKERVVTISTTGRPSVAKTTTGICA